MDKPGRTSPLPTAGEIQRRKVQRGGRRAFRAWPLLPVPSGALSTRSDAGPRVDWPQGGAVGGAEDWQDGPDRRDLGQEFVPAAQQRPWQEADAGPAGSPRSRLLRNCLLGSVALHLSGLVFFISMPSPETVEIAGGGTVSVMLVGEQAFDSLAAGTAQGEETAPAPDEAKPVETADQPVEATTTRDMIDPTEIETASNEPRPADAEEPVERPAEPAVERAQQEPTEQSAAAVENLPIDPASVTETGELTPVPDQVAEAESRPVEVAESPAPQPVDAVQPPEEVKPLPEPVKTPTEVKAPAPKKVEKPKADEKKTAARKKADVEREAKNAPARNRKGERGEATANAQHGTSASANSAARSDPGNAAVSNYPGKVAAKLRRALKYPRSAVSSAGGEAQVAFTVLADGSATGIRVVSSSGSPVLDQAAMDAVRKAAPFPPIPEEAGRRQWPFSVPVLFRR